MIIGMIENKFHYFDYLMIAFSRVVDVLIIITGQHLNTLKTFFFASVKQPVDL